MICAMIMIINLSKIQSKFFIIILKYIYKISQIINLNNVVDICLWKALYANKFNFLKNNFNYIIFIN